MANRYVDYDKLLEERRRLGLDERSMICKVNAFNHFIDNLPTADVVEVVRCKDCKYRTWFCPDYGCGNYKSPFYAGTDEDVPIMTQPDDFCSYGERRKDDE